MAVPGFEPSPSCNGELRLCIDRHRHLWGKSPELANILYGLIVGIGFIGSGTILKKAGEIRGNVTAASIWVTGAIGAATGVALYDVALVLSLVTFLTLRV